MDKDALRIEARKLAADHWYKGVRESVMAGAYDDLGDVVKFAETAILRGIEIAKPVELPEGLIEQDGKVLFRCRSCEHWCEWPAEIEDFDINDPHNVCGGSPRCCP